MSSGMKKGLLFVTVCVCAILALYAVWPTKMIKYLTNPVTSENDTESPRLSYHAGGSWPLVIRKKLPGLPQLEKLAASSDMPLVIVKKIPVAEPAGQSSVDVQPDNELSSVPATVADINVADVAVEKPSVSSAPKTVIAAESDSGTDQDQKQPVLKEAPAVHKIKEPIVPRPYSIMLASCRRLDSAETVRDTVRREGLSPYIVRVDLGQKGIWWRVFEGRYSSAGEASSVMKRHNLSQSLVTKTPFAIMIGAYSSEKDAAAEVQRLNKLKHSPYFVPAPEDKVRLLVGAFASQNGARQLMDELTARGIPNQIVKR